MVVDKLVDVLTKTRRRRWRARAIVAAAVVVALALAALAPDFVGRTPYGPAIIVVMVSVVLTDLPATLLASMVVFVSALRLDQASGSSMLDVAVRAAVFALVVLFIALGAEAFRRFQNRANTTLTELRTSEAVMRSILDTGPDAMLIIDTAGIVSRFSQAGETLFGWTAEEVVGRNVSMLMPPPYHGEHDDYVRHYLDTGERRIIGKSREVTGMRKDGTHFPMMLHVGEVRTGDERSFTGFVHDLTALHAANDRSHALRAEIAHIWSINSLGEMAAVLAHELNQPLAAIANYVRGARAMTARLELPDDELLNALDKAGDQAIRAGEIIRRMRSLVTRNQVDRKPESLAALVREIDFMTSLVAREAGATVRYTLASGSDIVLVDRIQIQQVIINLVRNGIEAMRETPRKRLAISTFRGPDAWVVRIEDSGPGISPADVGGLFQPLQSNKPQGMGLGLSICRTIVEGHAGTIWTEDSLFGGAAFCFSVPDSGKGGALEEDAADGLRH